MTLVYIHGASATSESFNYIRSKLGSGIDINYDSRNGFENNLNEMQAQLAGVKDIAFIAHSLGGVYSLHLANAIPEQVLGAVTLSTPYGGAEVAEVVKFFLPFKIAFSIAKLTSSALPIPTPTLCLLSPIITTARKVIFFPPFTTFVTLLI